MDIRREAREALETATKAVDLSARAVKGLSPKYCTNEVQNALTALQLSIVTLGDCCAQLARIDGVPNAIEPETGQATVTTEVS